VLCFFYFSISSILHFISFRFVLYFFLINFSLITIFLISLFSFFRCTFSFFSSFSFVSFFAVLDVVRMLKNYPVLDLSVFGLENVRTEERFEIGDELSRLNNGELYCLILYYGTLFCLPSSFFT
jgi:hypothetical protein